MASRANSSLQRQAQTGDGRQAVDKKEMTPSPTVASTILPCACTVMLLAIAVQVAAEQDSQHCS